MNERDKLRWFWLLLGLASLLPFLLTIAGCAPLNALSGDCSSAMEKRMECGK